MSFRTFFFASKSIRAMPPEKSPYSMRPDTRLPRFNPGRSGLFSSTVLPHRRQDNQFEGSQPACVEIELFPPSVPSATPTNTAMSTILANDSLNRKPVESSHSKPSFAPRPAPGVLGRMLSLWTGRSSGRRPLVQAEFDLSKVEVVRNDLLDSDLELIPSATRQSPPAKSDASVSLEAAPVRTGGRWTNLTSLLPSIRRGGV